MHLTKLRKTALSGLALAALLPLCAPTVVNSAPAGPSRPEISNDIAALWRSPSAGFAGALLHVGEEPRDVSIDKLRKFLNEGGTATEKQAASYALARLLTRGKNNAPTADERSEATELFNRSVSLPALRLPSLWHLAEISAARGDEAANRATLSKIAEDSGANDNDRARALYETAQSYLRLPTSPDGGGDNVSQARTLLLSLREKYPNSEQAKGAAYYLAQMAFNDAAGAPAPAAVAFLKEYIRWTANGRFSNEVADKLLTMSAAAVNPVPLANPELEQIAWVYYKRGDFARALSIYDRMGPEAKLFQRAQCYSKLGRKAEAASTLLEAIRLDPSSSSYDDFASTICVPLTKAEAADLWRSILKLNPKHADHALYNLATRVEDADAMPLLSRLLNQFPTSEHAPESLWWLFWHQAKVIYPNSVVKEKEKSLALIKLAQGGAARYPQHRVAARLAFWAGKIYEKLGQVESAKKEYELAKEKWPTNYYAARSRARLNFLAAAPEKRHDRAFSTSPNRQLSPDSWNWPQPPHLFSFDKVAPLIGSQAAVLAVTHQADEALSRIDASPAAHGEGADRINVDCLRSWLYLGQAMPMEGIRAAGRDLDGHPSRSPRWQISYPWAYASQINEAARKNSVDPYLVHALIREESRYFPMALSRSNAIGLMQLLPGTGFGVAKRIGLPISSKEEIFIPDNNIKMGTSYLAYTLGRFDGQAMLAVASYNGGPNAVKRWVDLFHARGMNDWDIFVENIPFRETRDYVRKVFGSYWTYEIIYQ